MALTYVGPTGLFTRLGKIAKQYLGEKDLADAIRTRLDELLLVYQNAGLLPLIDGASGTYESWESQHSGRRSSLYNLAKDTLTDRETILDELGATTSTIDLAVALLVRRMAEDGESVLRSVGSLGSPAPAANNVGNGVVLLTKILDGFSSPTSDTQPHTTYDRRSSELVVPAETMRLVCQSDSYTDGTGQDQESFAWSGGQSVSRHSVGVQGSGDIATVAPLTNAISLTNAGFDSFASNAPTGWTIENGAAGTQIFAEPTTFFRGTQSLKLTGASAIAQIKLSQAIPISRVESFRRYCFAFWLRAAAPLSAGRFEAFLEGTGYSATSTTPEVQQIQITGSVSGVYTLTWQGQTTDPIVWDADAETIQAALRQLSGLGMVVVEGVDETPPDTTFNVTFHGVQGDIGLLVGDADLLPGATIDVSTTTPGVEGEMAYIDATAIPDDAWAPAYFFVNLPLVIPSDLKLSLRFVSPANGESLLVDSVLAGPVQYGGGIGLVLLPGSLPFARNDRFTWSVSNSEGKFQRFFREAFRVQLPSSASPTIGDGLAT